MSQSVWRTGRPLVVDTNTVLPGLIGGVTRTLLLKLERSLYYPEPSFQEIHRNRGVIQQRASLSAGATDELLDRLFKHITLVSEAEVVEAHDQAASATSPHPDADPKRRFVERDEGDVVFLATALAIDGDIWSDDGVFKHQDYVEWFRTDEVIAHATIDS